MDMSEADAMLGAAAPDVIEARYLLGSHLERADLTFRASAEAPDAWVVGRARSTPALLGTRAGGTRQVTLESLTRNGRDVLPSGEADARRACDQEPADLYGVTLDALGNRQAA